MSGRRVFILPEGKVLVRHCKQRECQLRSTRRSWKSRGLRFALFPIPSLVANRSYLDD